jgi:hypothetical protein
MHAGHQQAGGDLLERISGYLLLTTDFNEPRGKEVIRC